MEPISPSVCRRAFEMLLAASAPSRSPTPNNAAGRLASFAAQSRSEIILLFDIAFAA
jgi:hypothetical protein